MTATEIQDYVDKHFDAAYNSLLEKYRSETKNDLPNKIYKTSLLVVGERNEFEKDKDQLATANDIEKKIPAHIKNVMLMDCLALGKRALVPYIPDPSVIMKYADEAAHITMQLIAKLRMGGKPPKGKRQHRFADAIEKFKAQNIDNKQTITKIIDYLMEYESTVKKMGESHEQARKRTRAAIQKDFNRYIKDRKGIK